MKMANLTSANSKKVLVFDIESEYGHFRKFNTTTSPLTYSIPTRPAIAGLIGAILGIERELSAGKFNKGVTPVADIFTKNVANIGVQIINPIQKVNIGFNLLDTEKTVSSFFNIKQRTQIEFELLKNPCFRIFISLSDNVLFSDLISRVQNNRTHFTPYLGISQFTASIQFKSVVEALLIDNNEFQEVVTAVNISNADLDNPVRFIYSQDFKYTSDTLPIEMLSNREVIEYSEVIVETTGKTIAVKSNQIYQTSLFGNILFL
jgi:CRISPR-associated protein Cas5h